MRRRVLGIFLVLALVIGLLPSAGMASEVEFITTWAELTVMASNDPSGSVYYQDDIYFLQYDSFEVIGTNFNIPEDETLIVSQSASLFVPMGVLFTNNGLIGLESGGNLNVEGTLQNQRAIVVHADSTLSMNGTYEQIGRGKLEHTGGGTITGISEELIQESRSVSSYTALVEVLIEAEGSSSHYSFFITDPITLENDITLQSNHTLVVRGSSASLTMPEGKSLTSTGYIQVWQGGTLVCNGTLDNRGVFENSGNVSVSGKLSAGASDGGVLESAWVAVTNGGRITVEDGGKFVIYTDGRLNVFPSDTGTGTVIVQGVGSELHNSGSIHVRSGTLTVQDSAIYTQNDGTARITQIGGTVAGIDTMYVSKQNYSDAWTTSDFLAALADADDPAETYNINVFQSIELTEDMTIGNNVKIIVIKDEELMEGSDGKIIVPSGSQLTVLGQITLYGGSLVVQNGGFVSNDGNITVARGTIAVQGGGSLHHKRGSLSVEAESVLSIVSGTLIVGNVDGDEGAQAQLYVTGGSMLTVKDGGAFTIHPDGRLHIKSYNSVNSSVTVQGTGSVLHNRGYITIDGCTLSVQEGATYTQMDEHPRILNAGGYIEGIDLQYINANSYSDVWDLEDLLSAISGATDPDVTCHINLFGEIVLQDNLIIGNNVELRIVESDEVADSEGKLTVPEGITLTIEGTIMVGGGVLANNGSILNKGLISLGGVLQNNGQYSSNGGQVVLESLIIGSNADDIPVQNAYGLCGDVDGDGEITLQDALMICNYKVGRVTELPVG